MKFHSTQQIKDVIDVIKIMSAKNTNHETKTIVGIFSGFSNSMLSTFAVTIDTLLQLFNRSGSFLLICFERS